MTSHISEFKNRLLAPYNGLHTKWFDGWHPKLDDALQELPEMESCPHELFKLLIVDPDSVPKKTVLFTEKDEPVAIASLHRVGRQSYELSTWMIPGALFPVKPGYLISALEALHRDVVITWHRMDDPPPSSPLIRYMQSTSLHVIRFSNDYESYWRENEYFKTIRNKRNRCKDFDMTVNSPGAMEWTIRNAAEKWRHDPTTIMRVLDDQTVSDGITFAKYWEEHGRHFTLLMHDRGKPIGGATMFVHRNCAIGGLIYRDPEYEHYGIGVRLIDLCISFAAEAGFDALDLGGSAGYKTHWAPQNEESFVFGLCPEPLFRAKQAYSWVRTKQKNLVTALRKKEN
jgi:GNAT superfamily N-acetyltransferase